MDFTQQICDAIEVIANKSVEQAGYDRTITATIVSCVDATIGKYEVAYQDSKFYAYAETGDSNYAAGTAAYILVPGNDMSRNKTIVGSVKKLGTNYTTVIEPEDRYAKIGRNIVEVSTELALKSRAGKIVRQVAGGAINNISAQQYLTGAKYIICGGRFRTNLTSEQQSQGTYGILFTLNFRNNTDGEIISKTYSLDIDKFRGNPYQLKEKTRQVAIFEIDGDNFVGIESIQVFSYGFPKFGKPLVDDIFVSDIELYAAEAISEEDLNGYSLRLTTPKGSYFSASQRSDLSIAAALYIKGKLVDPSSQDLFFYWFREDASVTTQSTRYNAIMGQGWRCLNDFHVVNADTQVIEWLPNSSTIAVKQNELLTKEGRWACVVVYDNQSFVKTIQLSNLEAQYILSIASDAGTEFHFDRGTPNLTCLVNGAEHSEYTYSWGVLDSDDTFLGYAVTQEMNEQFKKANDNLIALQENIKNGKELANATKLKLQAAQDDFDKIKEVMRVEGNKIYNLDLTQIRGRATIVCAVSAGDTYIGTAELGISNSLEQENQYSLVLEHGSQVFKYDTNGLSPTSSANEVPQILEALSFSLYDAQGRRIDDKALKAAKVTWDVPTENTMLRSDDSKSGLSLVYKLADRYDFAKTNNEITLTVVYKGVSLKAKTNFVFTKQGESGTNGTDFYCRIIPNAAEAVESPCAVEDRLGNKKWNFTLRDSGKPFRVQLWNGATVIYNGISSGTTTEGKQATVKWSILKNYKDETSFSVDAETGAVTFSGFKTDSPSNIIKAEIGYQGNVYYAIMPVVTVKLKVDDTSLSLVPHSGFQSVLYSSDGKQPRYATNPFEIRAERKVNGAWEDVSTVAGTWQVTYQWGVQGKVSGTASAQLIDGGGTGIANQRLMKPVDNYDGYCVNNAVVCTTSLGIIHIPVHFLLNRYGNSAINGWDGNTVEIDEKGGVILAPQVGAGKKESDNTFTGIVMGTSRESNAAAATGIMGYNHGQRSIFLDAETGMAQFGKAGAGQITLDPRTNKAQLYSGNYVPGKSGLMIDLTTPEIRFGNGAFVVDKDGKMTSKVVSDFKSEYDANNKTITTQLQTLDGAIKAEVTRATNGEEALGTRITATESSINSEVYNKTGKSALWSQINQTANSVSTKVGYGEVISAIEQSAEKIKISAKNIDFNGAISANGYFHITEEGRLILSGDGYTSKMQDGGYRIINNSFPSQTTFYGHNYLSLNGASAVKNVRGDLIVIGNSDVATQVIAKYVQASSSITLDGKPVATQQWVGDQHYLTTTSQALKDAVAAAEKAAQQAATSASNAHTSAVNALDHKNKAEKAATNAATSETNAHTSAVNAYNHKNAAATSAKSAAASASAAAESARRAAASASSGGGTGGSSGGGTGRDPEYTNSMGV